MKLFIVSVDEPIYLNPYIGGVIDDCGAEVVGVAVYRPRRRAWTRARVRRTASLGLLACLVFGPLNLARIAWWRLRALGGVGAGRSLGEVCAARRIPCTTVTSANAREFADRLRALDVDVLLHQSPEILRSDVLRAPKIGVLNRHLSALPAYRGAWPVFWQFVNGEPDLGITMHLVDDGIDTGPVVAQLTLDRRPNETLMSAHERLFARAVELTKEAMARLARGERGTPLAAAATVCYRTPSAAEVLAFMLGRRRAPVSVRV
jgi:folate-dependent phosphoribosylglycinamide formyltransferase PurN